MMKSTAVQVIRLRRDLKRTKALLRDAQILLERHQGEPGSSKLVLRQLRNQLEDAEFARGAALKGKQNTELELADVTQQLEDVSRGKAEAEERNLRLGREKADLQSALQENEEELQVSPTVHMRVAVVRVISGSQRCSR